MNRTIRTADPRLAAPVARPATAVLALTLGLALAGCQMGQGAGAVAPGEVATMASGPRDRVIERDVEAPEVFQAQEPGLWDGRPSLGGVWVAHPGARDPERVLIRNTRTGATVIGALFRRERENPGPRFQVSSEAANALGLLAGSPAEIQVTALRLQRVEMEIEPAPEPATAAAETLAITPVAVAPTPEPVAPGAVTPETPPQGQVAITDLDPEPRRGLRDLFRRRDPAPAASATIAETSLDAPAVASAPVSSAPVAPPAAEAPRGGLGGLFRRRAPEPDTTLIPLPAEAAPPQVAAAPTTPAATPAPAGPRVDRPFVQIAIFSVEQNAINARASMQRQGLPAEIRRGRVGENDFWRVVVGPAGSAAERAQYLERVRALGFADAYAVVR